MFFFFQDLKRGECYIYIYIYICMYVCMYIHVNFEQTILLITHEIS